MPGFRITQNEAQDHSKRHKQEFRRKHRWRFTTIEGNALDTQDWLQLEKAQRPKFTLEEAVVHHDQEEAYFAGKQKWDPITLTFYDAFGEGRDITNTIYEWVGSIVDLEAINVEVPSEYKKNVTLQMTDGSGQLIEEWTLYGAWPKDTNWMELDYTTSEIQRVEVVLRFDRALKTGGGN